MRTIIFDNYEIKTPITEILDKLQAELQNGKLRDVNTSGHKNIVVSCPFHSFGLEQKAAGNIYIGDDEKIPYGYFRCLVCNEQGSFAKFIGGCFDKSEEFGKAWLIKNFADQLFEKRKLGEDITIKRTKVIKKFVPNEVKIPENLQDWHPYMAERKISREICTKFNLKYDPFHQQILFPVYDLDNNLVMLPGRSINTKWFYIPSEVEKPIYCLNTIKAEKIKKFMLVEGPIDCLTCWTHGVPAVATLGQPSKEQIQLLNQVEARSIYLAYDSDSHGQAFTEFTKRILKKTIMTTTIELPRGRKDVNELSDEEWNNLIKKYNLKT